MSCRNHSRSLLRAPQRKAEDEPRTARRTSDTRSAIARCPPTFFAPFPTLAELLEHRLLVPGGDADPRDCPTSIRPPSGVNLIAFDNRFSTIKDPGAVARMARGDLVSGTPCGRSRRRSRRDLRRRKEEDDLLDELAHRLRTDKWEAATRLTKSPSSGSRVAATKTSDAVSALGITRRSDSQYRKLGGVGASRHAPASD